MLLSNIFGNIVDKFINSFVKKNIISYHQNKYIIRSQLPAI